MTPQEAADALERMQQWQGISNDEAHDLLARALETIASMRVEHGVAYGDRDAESLWEPWRWHLDLDAAKREANRVMEDAELVEIVDRMVSPSTPHEDGGL